MPAKQSEKLAGAGELSVFKMPEVKKIVKQDSGLLFSERKPKDERGIQNSTIKEYSDPVLEQIKIDIDGLFILVQ